MDNIQKETHVVSVMTNQPLATVAKVRDQKDDRLLPHQIRRQRPTVKKATKMKVLTREVRFLCRHKCLKTRHVNFGIFQCVRITDLKKDAHVATNVIFRHVEAQSKPSKMSKKGGAKGSVALLKESAQLGCVSQDSYPRKSIPREEGNLGSKHAVKFSKGTWHQKIRERKGPSRGIIQKCEPHERSPCAPKFGERSHEETLHQERCARRAAWDLAKKKTSSVPSLREHLQRF